MSQVLQEFVRNVFGIYLAAAVLLCGSNARAQTVPPQDGLWAWDQVNTFVCSNPFTATDLSGCFGGFAQTNPTGQIITTDGINVYAATSTDGWGYKCPITGPGTNNAYCSKILVGPFGNSGVFGVNTINALVADNEHIWTAQSNGTIWRCPSNVPWDGTIPSTSGDISATGCVVLDDAGNRDPTSLSLVNGTLYVGLSATDTKSALIWSCPSMIENACTVLDKPGNNTVYSLTSGAGYLWAGLANGIIWRCDLLVANSCSVWDKARQLINGISYDGQGTLGVIIETPNPSILWSCSTSNPNSCKTLVQPQSGSKPFIRGVAAGEGNVWGSGTLQSSGYYFSIWSGSAQVYSQSSSNLYGPALLYIPAGGITTNGTARVKVPFSDDATRLSKFCSKQGRQAMATVSVSGPYGMKLKRRVNLCKFYDANAVRSEIEFSALDYGQYRVTVQSRSLYGQADFVINNRNVQDVSVTLKKRRK